MDYIKKNYGDYYEKAMAFHQKYEDYFPAVFFAFGFFLDLITLGEVDDASNIVVLGLYLLAALAILSMEYLGYEVKEAKHKVVHYFFEYKNDIFHFLLGALLSAFTLFYFKSSSFANSFVFLIIMVSLLLLNELEVFQKKGIIIRSSLAMLCLVSYLVYVIPIALGQTSALIFYGCTSIAIFITLTAFFILNKLGMDKKQSTKNLLIPQLAVLAVYMSLYGFKVLPPIPLSIKYIGIFHEVRKTNGNYITKDLNPWWRFWNASDEDFQARTGDKVYIFTKIFAPGGFEGKVFIRFLKDTPDGYMTSDRIPLSITGGRAEGFRGYAYKQNYTPGEWQVRVETESGLEIGRINFTIDQDSNDHERKFNVLTRT